MNVASLELCKKLYELSGWLDTEHCYYSNAGEVNGKFAHQRSQVMDKDGNIPAYDLGYLLHKLPKYLAEKTQGIRLDLFDETTWRIGYPHTFVVSPDWHALFYAETPEDAAAKLCIELFKQGVLKRGDS